MSSLGAQVILLVLSCCGSYVMIKRDLTKVHHIHVMVKVHHIHVMVKVHHIHVTVKVHHVMSKVHHIMAIQRGQ